MVRDLGTKSDCSPLSERGCRNCGAQIMPPRRVCDECRRQTRTRAVTAYERRQRRLAGTPEVGVEMPCLSCGVVVVRNSATQKFCKPCATKRATERTVNNYRLINNVEPAGTVISCAHCSKQFPKRTAHSKYCEDCRAQYIGTKLSRARRLKTDPAFALRVNMGAAINKHLRTGKGGKSWINLVGYTPCDLKRHLERQFLPGMSWENRGLWHIDHIVPLALLPADTPDHPNFHRAWALCNLRPLWKRENEQKHKAALFLC